MGDDSDRLSADRRRYGGRRRKRKVRRRRQRWARLRVGVEAVDRWVEIVQPVITVGQWVWRLVEVFEQFGP